VRRLGHHLRSGGEPAIGDAFDRLLDAGGSGIFSETQEFIGAEHLLAARAASPAIADRIMRMVAQCEQPFLDKGVDMRGANPARGNIEGGLTTIEEKSLGAIAKGGTMPSTAWWNTANGPTARVSSS
jgi:altronate dehydratase large subunit